MRYYVMSVEHNEEKNAENRTVPKAYDSYDDAVAQFYTVLANDMKNVSLDWAFAVVLNDYGTVIKSERWNKANVSEDALVVES